jgi:hypothetical protein
MLQVISLALLLSLTACPLGAQPHEMHQHGAASRDSISAMATALSTTATPAVAGRTRTEAMVTQPMAMFRGSRMGATWQYAAMFNAEHWSMPGGEPVAGIWGEGFVDRRHPHTVLHEVMLTANRSVGLTRLSLSAGKGIVPFGTDDPMVRPLTKYPANHHLAQILERVQLIAAARFGTTVALEAALFNGDEPLSPTSAPQWSRFADSRAARLTVWPLGTVEIQASVGSVRSPEFVNSDGLDQRKLSSSMRWSPVQSPVRYGLVEWARTEERYAGRGIIAYGTGLAEAQLGSGLWTASVRAERTTRPEEERLLNLFRTARPPNDLTIKGLTRWELFSAQVARGLPDAGWARASVFVEATRARSAPVLRPVLLDPRDVIGKAVAWHITVGARIGLGAMPARVGRYGAAAGGSRTDVMTGMIH